MRGPVPEATMHAHSMKTPPPCFTDEALCFWIFCSYLFSHIFAFPSPKVNLCLIGPYIQFQNSSVSPLCFFANSNLAFLFLCWSEVCVLLCSICNSVSKSLRTVDWQSITPAFWKLLVILQTRLLGFIFTAFMICLSSTTVVFSDNQVIVGCWWFPNSWFLHALCFCWSSNLLPCFF